MLLSSKKKPFSKFENTSGLKPFLGILASESNLRKTEYIKRGGCNVLSGKRIISHPLSIWTNADIWEFIYRYDVPYSDIYDQSLTQTGCAFCGFGCHYKNDRRFEILYNLYPGMYKMCMEYENSGYTYREALRIIGVSLPDERLHFRED